MNALPVNTIIVLKHDLYGADVFGLEIGLRKGEVGHILGVCANADHYIVEFAKHNQRIAVEVNAYEIEEDQLESNWRNSHVQLVADQ